MNKLLGTLMTVCCLFAMLSLCHQQAFAIQYSHAGTFAVPEEQDGFIGEQYDLQAGKKLERGLKNFFLGWLEIPHGVKAEKRAREQEYLPTGIETFFIGFFKGTIKTAGRMSVGLYETFTFPYAQGPVIQEMEDWDSLSLY